MAICVKASPNPDGVLFFTPAPEISDLSTCQYVLQSGAEMANSLVSFTAEDGALISTGVISVWVTAYFVRSIIQIVKGSTEA